MDIHLEPASHMPVHAQISEQIKFLILSGEIQPGNKLPTAVEMAASLRVNSNTVLKAYQTLVRQGLIECQRGRGCIVVDRSDTVGQKVYPHILAIIDRAIEQASRLGVNPEDFSAFAYARARQRRATQLKQQIVFVECATPIASELAQIIQRALGIQVVPVVLHDLKAPTPGLAQLLAETSVVATTFFHVQEVRGLLGRAKKEIVALGLKPHLESLLRIAAIPPGTPTAVVCVSVERAQELQQSLEDAGITGLKLVLGGTDDLPRLAETIQGLPVVIASDFESVVDKVRPLVQPGQELIVLAYMTLDEGAINLLRTLVSEATPVVQVD